jgi:hypothetical protein
MEAVQTVEPSNVEAIWAILRESAELGKEVKQTLKEVVEAQKETEQILKKNAKEWEKRQKEWQKEAVERQKEAVERQKETEREMKESADRLDKQLGKLGNRFGEMVEHLVMPNLVEKFRNLGFVFTKAYPHAEIKDKKNNIITEIDITLENGDKVMIVEVKSKLTIDDITDHIERMEKVKAHADLHDDKRKFLGAIAGMVMSESEKTFALKNGFYVIEPSGETFTITVPEGIYSPREW